MVARNDGGSSSSQVSKVGITKLGVVGSSGTPYVEQIVIPQTSDFFMPPVEVLKFKAGALNYVSTLCSFNNGDATSFNAGSTVLFDGKMQLKTLYQDNMTDNGMLGSGKLFTSISINKALFKKLQQLDIYPTPTATDLTIPSGTITASGGTNPANAFNNTTGAYSTGWYYATAPTFPAHITYDFGTPTTINKVRIWSYISSGYEPVKNFRIVGSNTGAYAGEEATLYTGMHSSDVTNGFIDYTFVNNTGYRYIRFYADSCYAGNGGNQLSISELEYQYADTPKFLIQDGTDIIKLTGNTRTVIGTAPVTEAMFTANGMTQAELNAVSEVGFNTIVASSFNLLTYTPASAVYQSKLTSVPNDTLVLANGDISLTSVENIDNFNLVATTAGNGAVKLIVSTDMGNTWYTFNGTSFVTINPTAVDVKASGITPAVFNGITSAQWASFMPAPTRIRFGYVLSMDNASDTANTDTLTMQVDMRGSWDKAKEAEATYSYTSNTLLEVYLMANGDFKICRLT